MKKYLSLIFLLTILVSGCSQEELLKNESTNLPKITAGFEQDESRTYIEEGNLLRWTENDQISFFYKSTLNLQYKFDGETGDNAGTFSPVNQVIGTGNELSRNYAVYPYASDIKIAENGIIATTLPAVQSYAENSFGLSDNTMVAVTQNRDDTFLKFKNVCGYLKLQLYGDDVTIKSITLTGNNNEKLAGKTTITPIYGQSPTISMATDATKTITLECGEGVKIGSTEKTATAFWMVVPPITFENGFEITITNINGDTFKKSTSNDIVIDRNVIKPMEAFKVTMDALELPAGKTFNSSVGTFSLSNTRLKKLKFVANSQNTSETLLCADADGSTAYLVANGEWLEIHTSANNFRANADCSHMFKWDFYGNNSFFADITEIDFGGCFNTSKVEDMSYMFYESASLSSLDLSGFNTASVHDMSNMFYYCTSLTSLDISSFNTSNVTNMDSMFESCSALVLLDVTHFNTEKVTSMKSMFNYCPSLVSLDVSGFNTEKVTSMESMFSYCSGLTSLDVSGFNTEKVTSMESMFSYCSGLTLLDVSNFKTSNVTSMGYMFQNCSALTSLDVSKFNISNVVNMTSMFYNCSAITSLNVSNFNTKKAKRLSALFYGCSKLSTIDVSGFNTANATSMSKMFYGCSNLKTIDVSKFNTANVTSMGGMFEKCTSLTSLNLLSFTFDEYPEVSSMFDLVGSTADSCPIPVKVTKDGYIYLTQVTNNCEIDPTYAKFVNADGSACHYEEDPRVYNSKTQAVMPEKDANGVYLIQSAANLKWFEENAEKSTYNNAHYKLTTDILSENIPWDPVWFYGTFDGGNHFIANLKYGGYDELAYGFFGSMNGTVKNLILKNPQINQYGDNDGYGMNSGLLAAKAQGTIINCGIIGGSVSVSSTSKAWANGGGLVGRMNGGTIKGCFVIDTKIKGSYTRNGTWVGGLIGECSGNVTITSCYTKDIEISGSSGCNIGTFIGHSKSSTVTLTTCYYDSSMDAIGGTYSTGIVTTNGFEALTESNFTQAITKMNANLTNCDYIFDKNGLFIERK